MLSCQTLMIDSFIDDQQVTLFYFIYSIADSVLSCPGLDITQLQMLMAVIVRLILHTCSLPHKQEGRI